MAVAKVAATPLAPAKMRVPSPTRPYECQFPCLTKTGGHTPPSAGPSNGGLATAQPFTSSALITRLRPIVYPGRPSAPKVDMRTAGLLSAEGGPGWVTMCLERGRTSTRPEEKPQLQRLRNSRPTSDFHRQPRCPQHAPLPPIPNTHPVVVRSRSRVSFAAFAGDDPVASRFETRPMK